VAGKYRDALFGQQRAENVVIRHWGLGQEVEARLWDVELVTLLPKCWHHAVAAALDRCDVNTKAVDVG
jgi:hypothetical protein